MRAATAFRYHPALQDASKQRGSMQPQIYQENDRAHYPDEEQRARGPGSGFELAGSAAHRTARLKQQQPDRRDDGGARQIKKPFERIDSKEVGDGQVFL